MDSIKTGNLIFANRKAKNMTQKELADKLNVSDKTISKWERGAGCPDIDSINNLAEVLGVNVTDILSGESVTGDNNSANMKKTKFYVCPICGNVITSSNDMIVNCCGRKVAKLQPNKEADNLHTPSIEVIDGDLFIQVGHEMEKNHYISFMAFATSDQLIVRKLYPEQNAETRFHRVGHGILYVYCNRHGLFSKII